MKTFWRTLGLCAGLALAACGGGDDGDGEGDTDEGSGSETASCTGSYTGAVTGRVKSCSLSATRLSTGEVQYFLEVGPEPGSGSIGEGHNLLMVMTGEPKTGTYDGTVMSQVMGTVEATDGKQYSLQRGLETDLGSVVLTLDSVPAGQAVGDSTLYQGFGGKAQLQYVAAPGSAHTGEVNLTVTFKP